VVPPAKALGPAETLGGEWNAGLWTASVTKAGTGPHDPWF